MTTPHWLCALALVPLLLAPACGRDDAHLLAARQEPEPIHVRVTWIEDPQHTAIVSWTTVTDTRRNRLRLDDESREGELNAYSKTLAATSSDRFTRRPKDDPELWFHHVRLTGLEPSTTYWFVVESDGAVSRELHFVTAPADDRAVTILSGGDSRSNRDQRCKMNRLIASLVDDDPSILAFAHGGDYVWQGFRLDLFSEWLSDHELTVTEDGRVLPIIPTRGNHENKGELFDEIFHWPGGDLGGNYFALRLSEEVLLITLNTECAAGGDQSKFLERTLRDADGVRWKLAQYHRALWPAVKKDPAAKQHWVPLFERYNLDLALESDGHVLKRTIAIRDGEPAADGVVYIGEGGLGVKQRKPDTERWFLTEPGFAASAHHVWKLRFDHESAELTAIGEDGEVADRGLLSPRTGDD